MSASDHLPTASLDLLRRRAELLARLRRFFEERGFLEVDTPLLSADTVVDRHIDPVLVLLPDNPRDPERGRTMWLQTSPEFHMKRLLAAGFGPMYQVTRSFRIGERGALHNPEFTIAEWYRPGDDYRAGMQLLSDLAEVMLDRPPAEILTYREAFGRYADIDPLSLTWSELLEAARDRGLVSKGRSRLDLADPPPPIALPEGMSRADETDAWLDLILVECVAPHLGRGRPAILCDYPPSQAALARVREGERPVAERFELYVDGIELANGYHELLDAEVLRRRNCENNALRSDDGKYLLPEESRLLAAMEAGLPACSGCALGFDRLVMVVTGAKSIKEVLPFPIERA